jgi:Mg-chelatase subunit ChlD
VNLLRAIGAIAVVCLGTAFVSAQDSTRRIFVRVQTVNGSPVTTLATPDFHVRENGIERPVVRAALATAPMRILLLVDASATMGPMLTDFRRALHEFADTLPDGHEVAFISVSGQLRVRAEPTADRDALQKAISLFASDGGANVLIDALFEADRRFLRTAPERWPVIVLVTTDSVAQRRSALFDQFDAFTSNLVLRAGTAHGVVIRGRNAMGLNTEIARSLSQNTGGIFEQVAISNSLHDHMRKIAERIAADHEAMANTYEVEWEGGAGRDRPNIDISVARERSRLSVSLRRPF